MSIFERIAELRESIPGFSDREFLDHYYYTSPSPVFTNAEEACLRGKIARHLDIKIHEVLIVGSAQIGCTLTRKAPKPKLGIPERPPLSPFCDTSDIDIAIISSRLYVEYWQQVFECSLSSDWPEFTRYKNYHFRGWMRPDLLPPETCSDLRKHWFDFFRGIQSEGLASGAKIAAGIYYSADFWEAYTLSALNQCRAYLEETDGR